MRTALLSLNSALTGIMYVRSETFFQVDAVAG